MKRSIVIQHNDETQDKELEIGRYNLARTQGKNFIFIEEMEDGKWRLTASEGVIPDFTKVDGFKIKRED